MQKTGRSDAVSMGSARKEQVGAARAWSLGTGSGQAPGGRLGNQLGGASAG